MKRYLSFSRHVELLWAALIVLVVGACIATAFTTPIHMHFQPLRPPMPTTTQATVIWRIYTNTNAGFSFQYPVGTTFNEVEDQPGISTAVDVLYSQKSSHGYTFDINFAENAGIETVEGAARRAYQTVQSFCTRENSTLSPLEGVVVSGRKGLKYSVDSCKTHDDTTVVYWIANGKGLFIIDYTYNHSDIDALQYLNQITKMLSSLRFF